MKSLYQVVVPIAAVIGLVVFLTFIANFTKSPTINPAVSEESPPLHFQYLLASPDNESLWWWQKVYPPEEEGHFDYWFTNTNPQEVELWVDHTNCQCTRADIGLIPKEAWNDFIESSAVQGLMGSPAGAVFNAASAVQLQSKIKFEPMMIEKNKDNPHFRVPAADSKFGPALGMVRMVWVPRGDQPSRTLNADLLSQLPNKPLVRTSLKAQFGVMPPMHIYTGDSPTSAEIKLGILEPGEVKTAHFWCWSATRPELNLTVSSDHLSEEAAHCVEWTQPVALNEAERAELAASLSPKGPVLPLRSAYRLSVTVREHRKVNDAGKYSEHQLDMGPLDFQLVLTNKDDGTNIKATVTALVKGDIRLSGAAVNNFRINLGDAFNTDVDRVVRVSVFSDRVGLDVELDPKETKPDFLRVQLTPEGESAGLKQWGLKVVVPAGQIGALPRDSAVVLKTKDASQRRIRIPVRGTATGSGDVPRI